MGCCEQSGKREEERTKEEMIITHGSVGESVRSGDVGDDVGKLVKGESGRDVCPGGSVGVGLVCKSWDILNRGTKERKR